MQPCRGSSREARTRSTAYLGAVETSIATQPMDAYSDTTKSTAARTTTDMRKGLLRSRLTNHRDELPNLDGRSAAARRFRDLVNAFISDMGGIEECSEIKLGLIRRLASIVVQSEIMEARMVAGANVDIATLCTLASTTVRISSRLGLERRQRSVMAIDPLDYAREASLEEAAE